MERWSVQNRFAAVELFIKESLLQLHSMVFDSSFRDMMLLAAVLGY